MLILWAGKKNLREGIVGFKGTLLFLEENPKKNLDIRAKGSWKHFFIDIFSSEGENICGFWINRSKHSLGNPPLDLLNRWNSRKFLSGKTIETSLFFFYNWTLKTKKNNKIHVQTIAWYTKIFKHESVGVKIANQPGNRNKGK